MDKAQQKKYEITFHTLTEDANEVKREIEKAHGTIIEEKPFVKMELAYPIEKQKFVFCRIIVFSMKSEEIKELSEGLKLSKVTLRHLINSVSKKKEENEKNDPHKHPEGDGPTPSMKIRSFEQVLTNEALEKKIEEILQ